MNTTARKDSSNNSTSFERNKEVMSDMQTGIGKLHFVKKDGEWMRFKEEKYILHSRTNSKRSSSLSKSPTNKLSELPNTSFYKHSHSSGDTIERLHRQMSTSHSNQGRLKIRSDKSTSHPHRDQTNEHCFNDYTLNDDEPCNRIEVSHSQKANSHALSAAEICAELECTPNSPQSILSSLLSRDELPLSSTSLHFSRLCQKTNKGDFLRESTTSDSFQKPIRSNTKENSPVKENIKFQQFDENAGILKAELGYGPKVSVLENVCTVSSGNAFPGLGLEMGISVLPDKLDSVRPNKCKSPAKDSMLGGMKEKEGNVKIFSEIMDNIFNVSTEKVVKKPSPTTLNNILTEHKSRDTSRKHKAPSIFGARESFFHRKVSVDALLKSGEIQMGNSTLNSPQHIIDLSGQTCDVGQVSKEAGTNSNVDFALPTSYCSLNESGNDSCSSFSEPETKRRHSKRRMYFPKKVDLIVEGDVHHLSLPTPFDSKGLINIDQLFQDLSGIPMVQLEKLSDKTLQHYYGIKLPKFE